MVELDPAAAGDGSSSSYIGGNDTSGPLTRRRSNAGAAMLRKRLCGMDERVCSEKGRRQGRRREDEVNGRAAELSEFACAVRLHQRAPSAGRGHLALALAKSHQVHSR